MSALRWRELTATGVGAVRVLRLEGPGAADALAAMCAVRTFTEGTFGLACLRDRAGVLLDEALVRRLATDAFELHLHGAPAVVARVLAELGNPAPVPAAETLEARAEERLANAGSEAAARLLLDQAEGALRRAFEGLLTLPESARVTGARALARRGRVGEALARPRRVVLVGPVNAGKSTLFNLLLGRERVVVDAAAGTTRDVIHERALLGAYPVELFDTAGRRELTSPGDAAEAVERAGQLQAVELEAGADWVLELVPPGTRAPAARPRVCQIASRADEGATDPALARLSAHADPHGARALVERSFLAGLGLPPEPWWKPGEAVPFEPEWNAVLAQARGAELTGALERWLAAR